MGVGRRPDVADVTGRNDLGDRGILVALSATFATLGTKGANFAAVLI